MSHKSGGAASCTIPFRSNLRILLAKGNNAADVNMNVDASGGAVTWTTTWANGTTLPWTLTRLTFQIIDTGATTGLLNSTFGLVAALTNGCKLNITDGTYTVDLAGGYRTGTTSMNLIKTNGDMLALSTRTEQFQVASATATPMHEYIIDFCPALSIPAGGKVNFITNDNLTGLLDFRCLAEGHLT